MSDTVCALPFIHFNILSNGQASVCCASTAPLLDRHGQIFNVRTHTLDQIWRSDALRDVRRKMLANEKPIQCAECYKNEELFGGRSHRTQQNALFLTDNIENLAEQETASGFPKIAREQLQETANQPWYFDLRFDNLCNLKCVICYGFASSQIERDSVHLQWTGESVIERVPNRFGNSPNWVESQLLFDELKAISSQARYIQLAGGEPFLSSLALRWLGFLTETGLSKNISMMVFTNFQRFDETIIKHLACFKRVYMQLSIDAVGKIYEYVRFPGKWSRIEKNAERLEQELKGRLANTSVSLNVTLSVPSALSVCEVLEFARKHGFNANLNNASYPLHISSKFLPRAAKRKFEEMLRAYAESHPDLKHLAEQTDQWMTELGSVDAGAPEHRASVHNVMRFLNDMDVSRGLDFRAVQPELYDDYVSEIGYWLTEGRFSAPVETWTLGTLEKDEIVIDGQKYSLAKGIGGSVEGAHATPQGYQITGWAADQLGNRPAKAVLASIGDDIVARTVPHERRRDIEAGIGSEINPAGFAIEVLRRGNRPTLSEPIRLFALTSDYRAVRLASAIESDTPLERQDLR